MSLANSYDVIIDVDCEECAECANEGKKCDGPTWRTTMEFDDNKGYAESQCPTCKHIRIFEARK